MAQAAFTARMMPGTTQASEIGTVILAADYWQDDWVALVLERPMPGRFLPLDDLVRQWWALVTHYPTNSADDWHRIWMQWVAETEAVRGPALGGMTVLHMDTPQNGHVLATTLGNGITTVMWNAQQKTPSVLPPGPPLVANASVTLGDWIWVANPTVWNQISAQKLQSIIQMARNREHVVEQIAEVARSMAPQSVVVAGCPIGVVISG